ncbi:hypothetical protein GETHPA_13120 [Geothrix rubra]|uniref:Uncharacterized protein n=1 Tax=Geothrix rubra TaxID=2927977 RepID=A0ABQ5Q607_9BACT|nr:hypothetical protein [Geothrix rubra]GLH69779.1 hypothetical protein GETHPA_13120 [Geothrix rubra]
MPFRSALVSAFLAAALLAQAPPKAADPVPPAQITLTTPFPVHLGSVGPKEVREAVYGIKSLADHPFHLRVLDLSLGLELDGAQFKEALQPGEVRMVHVRVNPDGMLGYIRGAVRLGTDDPAQPFYILRYDMFVRPEVAVDAERRSLGEVAPWESPTALFRFTREGGEPVRVELASVLPPYLQAEVVPHGTVAELRVTLRPSLLKPGMLAGLEVLQVTTNAPRQPSFTLYLDWRLALPVMPSPSRLVYDDPKTTLLAVELRARDGKPFRLQSAEIEGKGYELVDRPGPTAERQTLRVRRLGTTSALLVLRFPGSDEPLRIPLDYLDPKAKGPAPQSPVPEPEHHPHH